MRTAPSGNNTAVEWYSRGIVVLPIPVRVNLRVAGS